MRYHIPKVIFFSLFTTLVMSSCKKSFLEEPKPGSSLAATDVFASEEGVRSYFNGIYRLLRVQYGSQTDVWGIASVNLAREAKGLDITLPDGAGAWYGFDYTHDNREPNYRRTQFTWEMFYDLVNQANNIIYGVTNSTALGEAVKPKYIAEGKALRAWSYFELVREFAHAYSEDPEGKGVPIYTEPSSANTAGKPRAKLSENFNLIVDDLKYAVANLPTTRQLKDVINKDVANGLLARVYLEMKDYTNAKLSAQAAKTNFPLTPSQYFPQTDITKAEVIWGFPQASDQSIFYGTPSAHYGYSGLVYNGFYIDSLFVNSYKATDIRRATFVNTGRTDFKRWVTKKFGSTTNFADHIIMMRSPEMWLIEAEAKAHLGEADAAVVLYTIQKNRDPNALPSGNTGPALINEILYERRKELFGEIGISFLDVKRLGLPFVRDAGHPTLYRFNFPPNSNVFTLKIPQVELDANHAITLADQNP
jgi:starch-binding outer membrane protein, SusD/RagB family